MGRQGARGAGHPQVRGQGRHGDAEVRGTPGGLETARPWHRCFKRIQKVVS